MAFPATSRRILFSMVSRAAVAFPVWYTPRLQPLRFKAASSGSGTKCGMVWLVRRRSHLGMSWETLLGPWFPVEVNIDVVIERAE